jgi:hypothetical protein
MVLDPLSPYHESISAPNFDNRYVSELVENAVIGWNKTKVGASGELGITYENIKEEMIAGIYGMTG